MTVREGTATKRLRQWDRVAARIVPVMGKNVLAAGGLLPFTPQASETLFDGFCRQSRMKTCRWSHPCLPYHGCSTCPDPSDPMATYSFQWMWMELGVQDLRQ